MIESNERPFVTTWGGVIASLDRLSRFDVVCFGDGPHDANQPCMVADTNAMEPEEDIPRVALERGFVHCISTGQLVDVRENLVSQGIEPDADPYLRAIAYFVVNDAFLDFNA